MLKLSIPDRMMYADYLSMKTELKQLKQYNRGHYKDRIKELEISIKKYLDSCNKIVLRCIILWELDIETEM